MRRLLCASQLALNETTEALSAAALQQAAGDCDIVLADRLTEVDAAFFDNAPRLIAFVRAVVDTKGVDIDAASRNGILVASAAATFVPGVTEWIVGQMINLARGTFDYVQQYRAGLIPDLAAGPRGRQLAGRTAGILGLGKIGGNLARILQALEMRVLGCDPHLANLPPGVGRASFDQLLREADFVICLAKHTGETDRLMNAAAFARMQRSAFFVNASRGGLVDEAALADALAQGVIAGAALDVGSAAGDTPPARLGAMHNVLATPHVAPSIDANHAQGRLAIAMVASVLRGEIPDGAINPEAASRIMPLAASRDT
ncbi:MAG: hydroxyacid dehydrogenase [Proteobacteria bacterium]|nr:hydroxyacid dehydrogenase [Pseudomonadota bacterium]